MICRLIFVAAVLWSSLATTGCMGRNDVVLATCETTTPGVANIILSVRQANGDCDATDLHHSWKLRVTGTGREQYLVFMSPRSNHSDHQLYLAKLLNLHSAIRSGRVVGEIRTQHGGVSMIRGRSEKGEGQIRPLQFRSGEEYFHAFVLASISKDDVPRVVESELRIPILSNEWLVPGRFNSHENTTDP